MTMTRKEYQGKKYRYKRKFNIKENEKKSDIRGRREGNVESDQRNVIEEGEGREEKGTKY